MSSNVDHETAQADFISRAVSPTLWANGLLRTRERSSPAKRSLPNASSQKDTCLSQEESNFPIQ